MSNCSTIVSVLTSNGSDQKQRYISALQPENIRLNDFEITDWILFAHNFSEYVNYYETTNSETPTSDWKSFFDFFELTDKNPSVENQLRQYVGFDFISKSRRFLVFCNILKVVHGNGDKIGTCG